MFFANPLFLIGLVAVGIPIAVHLFNFRRYRKVYFSNVDYLEELRSETKQQSTLRRLLILAARILTIVFLVLAFAQPVLPDKQHALRRGGTAVSLYIDNSFSMENTNAEGTLLETAKHKAREIVAAYKPTDMFQLLTNDVAGTQFRWLSRDEFLTALDEVESSSASPQLSAMARRQHDFLHSSHATNCHAYLLSDFQLSVADWEQFPADTSLSTTFVPLEGVAVSNLFIDSVALSAPAFYRGSSVGVTVSLRNTADSAVTSLPVRLFVNGRQRALATVDLPAGGAAETVLQFKIESDSAQHCHVEIADYPITFDDRFYFAVNVSSQVDMLVVNGAAENPYLHRLFATDSAIHYRTVAAHSIDFSAFSNHHLIVLNEVDNLPTGLSQTLLDFVRQGGSLLVLPAAKADVASYNSLLQQLQAPQLGAFVVQELKSNGVNVDDALYRNVFAQKPDDMELPSVHACYRLMAGASTVVSPIITLVDGSLYLTATRCGSGMVYLFASPLQTQYTDFVQQALFVATLHNMALYSQPPSAPYHLLGSADAIPLPFDIAAETVTLRQHNGTTEIIPDIRRFGSRSALYPRGQLRQADTYRLLLPDAEMALAFNYSRSESAMQFCSAADIATAIKDHHLNGYSVVRHADRSLEQYVRQKSEGRRLWRWCLVLALMMLLAEEVLQLRDRELGIKRFGGCGL